MEGEMTESSPMSWILWPFEALWGFVTWILELTGRLIAIVLGVVLMIAGLIVSITFSDKFLSEGYLFGSTEYSRVVRMRKSIQY
jgi:hypothetical protein